ncbi:MAG TPA: Rieske 2Fe-2S domain-containing protein [Methanomassiliicoccales archaeon]|nr:Rieske 2Fe-2S domain-containing protein [Methanomassiliicoccales archaeon]
MVKVKVGKKSEMAVNSMIGVSAEEKMILVANVDGKIYSVQGFCTHMGGHLYEGKLIGNVVKCPRHGSEFDLTTGKNLKGPWIPLQKKPADLKTYVVIVEGDDVYVEV